MRPRHTHLLEAIFLRVPVRAVGVIAIPANTIGEQHSQLVSHCIAFHRVRVEVVEDGVTEGVAYAT